MNQHEAERIASAIHRLRPDWPEASLATFIAKKLHDRPRRDVCVALAWIACEPNTATPARVLEAGPWWKAAAAETDGRPRPPKFDPRTTCGICGKDRPDCERTESAIPADRHRFVARMEDRGTSGSHVAELRAALANAQASTEGEPE